MVADPNHSHDETSEHPGHFLREWRGFMGWSQEELGDMAGVHYTTIGRIETGKRKLKTGFLRKLARIFKAPASALLEVNPSTEAGAQTAEMLLAWSELPVEKRADVLAMIRALTNPYRKTRA